MLSIKMFSQSDIERYHRYIPKDKDINECWEWTGSYVTKGYGYFSAKCQDTKKRYQLGAHRFTALIKYGYIPEGVFAMHTCDNPRCCNPSHIELGSPQKNTQDAVDRGLIKHAKGEQHGRSKLTEEQARYILTNHRRFSRAYLARKFNISGNTVTDIVKGRRWKHLSAG